MLGFTFSSKLHWCSYIISIAETANKKFLYINFLLQLPCISINIPYDHPQNTVAMSGLALLVATWHCEISYKNEYTGLFVLSLHPQNVACLRLFYRYYFGRYSSELAELVPLPYSQRGLLIILIDCMIFLSSFLDVTRMAMSTVSFLAQLGSGIFWLQNAVL